MVFSCIFTLITSHFLLSAIDPSLSQPHRIIIYYLDNRNRSDYSSSDSSDDEATSLYRPLPRQRRRLNASAQVTRRPEIYAGNNRDNEESKNPAP